METTRRVQDCEDDLFSLHYTCLVPLIGERNEYPDSSSSGHSQIDEYIVSLLDTDENEDELGCHYEEFDEESTRMKRRILHCESCLSKENTMEDGNELHDCLVPRSTDNNLENTANIPDTKRQPQMGMAIIACQLVDIEIMFYCRRNSCKCAWRGRAVYRLQQMIVRKLIALPIDFGISNNSTF